MKSVQLKSELKDATDYVAKFGAPEPHLRPTSYGSLHKVVVSTEICHQASPSATNYWKSSHFDHALSEVIRNNFPKLAAEAIQLMEEGYRKQRIQEKDALLSQLAEIEALERQEQTTTA